MTPDPKLTSAAEKRIASAREPEARAYLKRHLTRYLEACAEAGKGDKAWAVTAKDREKNLWRHLNEEGRR